MARLAIQGWAALAGATAVSVALGASDAAACGGFFCGRQPVDQTAERILFEVGQDSVTMTTQISFNGKAEDFAWVLPLSAVPSNLEVFQQQALNALDSNSGPVFNPPDDPACQFGFGGSNCQVCARPAVAESVADSGVTVYIRQEVGEYDVAVIESDDPEALVAWLLEEGYRITPAMEPYIERYTAEGMKFLALKLLETADVKDLKPFRFSLPGTAPSIPLRMTAIAAEPEMAIVVFVLGDARYEGKNWPNLEIDDDKIRYNPFSFTFPIATNWSKLVAEGVDRAGGQGWVTEFAGPSASYAEQVRQQVQNDAFATPEDREAATQLLGVLEAHPYLTRLYTRLSAEEMTSDPIFGRNALGDVARDHQLSRVVDGIDQCSSDVPTSTDPCDFATCGAAGLCRPVTAIDAAGVALPETLAAGCACVPGATARTTFAPDGQPTVICQDGRMSFLNAGDRESDTVETLPDACAGFDCGNNGQCIAMNMTPTCVCDQGFVAVGAFAADGTRATRCVEPPELVPAAFYEGRLPTLPSDLPGGRQVDIRDPVPMPEPVGTPGVPTMPVTPAPGFPMPRSNPALGSVASNDGGGCSIAAVGSPAPLAPSHRQWSWALAASAVLLGRRRATAATRRHAGDELTRPS